ANDAILFGEGNPNAVQIPELMGAECFRKCGPGFRVSALPSIPALVGVERWLVPIANVSLPEVAPDEPLIERFEVGRDLLRNNRQGNRLRWSGLTCRLIGGIIRIAQFIGVCRRLKWSKHVTNSPFLALRATDGSNAARKIISACSNAF